MVGSYHLGETNLLVIVPCSGRFIFEVLARLWIRFGFGVWEQKLKSGHGPGLGPGPGPAWARVLGPAWAGLSQVPGPQARFGPASRARLGPVGGHDVTWEHHGSLDAQLEVPGAQGGRISCRQAMKVVLVWCDDCAALVGDTHFETAIVQVEVVGGITSLVNSPPDVGCNSAGAANATPDGYRANAPGLRSRFGNVGPFLVGKPF